MERKGNRQLHPSSIVNLLLLRVTWRNSRVSPCLRNQRSAERNPESVSSRKQEIRHRLRVSLMNSRAYAYVARNGMTNKRWSEANAPTVSFANHDLDPEPPIMEIPC